MYNYNETYFITKTLDCGFLIGKFVDEKKTNYSIFHLHMRLTIYIVENKISALFKQVMNKFTEKHFKIMFY